MQRIRGLTGHVLRQWCQLRRVSGTTQAGARGINNRSTSRHYFFQDDDSVHQSRHNERNSVIQPSKWTDFQLLERGIPYGLDTLEDLRHACVFTEDQEHITDNEPLRSDVLLWQLLLDFGIADQSRNPGIGNDIVGRMIHGLVYRTKEVDLSAEDELTSQFWLTLLDEVTRRHDLATLKTLCQKRRLIWQRQQLFPEVIASALHNMPREHVISMAEHLTTRRHPSAQDGAELFKHFNPQTESDINKFKAVYLSCEFIGIYDQVMMHLHNNDLSALSLPLHRFLISQQDFPSRVDSMRPMLLRMAQDGTPVEPVIASLRSAGFAMVNAAGAIFQTEVESPGLSPGLDISGSVSDAFAAKAFAAKSLSFSFILNSLKAFGLRVVGPQAFREIGLGCNGTEEFLQRLNAINSLDLDLGLSAYSRILRKVCQDQNETMFRALLQTDMHHDVFDDKQLQGRLLAEALRSSDWDRMNLLLLMLNNGESNTLNDSVRRYTLDAVSNADARSILGLLLSEDEPCSSTRKWDVDRAVGRRIYLFSTSLRTLQKSMTPEQYTTPRMLTLITIGIMQDALISGIKIKAGYWKHILGRLIECGDFETVDSLCDWLPRAITQHHEAQDLEQDDPNTSTMPVFDRIFGAEFQRQFFTASLQRSLRTRIPAHREQWKRCLATLYNLHNKYDVGISEPVLRRIVADLGRHFMPKHQLGELGPHYAQACRFVAEVLHYVYSIFQVPRVFAESQIDL